MMCGCGCGQPAPIAKKTDASRGYVAGSPRRFVLGHANRLEEYKRKGRGFWAYVEKQSENGCWIWTGGKTKDGYGIHIIWRAHTVAYENVYGKVAPGLEIDHLCNVRACVNPSHLEAVTHEVNTERAVRRRERCGNGHLWSENEITWKEKRACRTCQKERGIRRRKSCCEVTPPHVLRRRLASELWAQGVLPKEIAAQLGVTMQSVRHYLADLQATAP